MRFSPACWLSIEAGSAWTDACWDRCRFIAYDNLSGFVMLQTVKKLARLPTVAVDLQPAAAHSFDRAFEPIKAMLASSQRGGNMPAANAAAIISTVISEANGVIRAINAAVRQCRSSPQSHSGATHPTADQIAAAEKAAAALLEVMYHL